MPPTTAGVPVHATTNTAASTTATAAKPNHEGHGNDDDLLLGLRPRSWEPWWSSRSSAGNDKKQLCFDPGHKLQTQRTDGNVDEFFPVTSNAFDPSRMFSRGLVFVKPMKVGGSSASGVNLRISKNMASRLHRPYKICENNFDHAMGYMFRKRNKEQSFLWTLLRDPTKRAVSGFWHFRVSREEQEPNMENFLKELHSVYKDDKLPFYLNMHALSPKSVLSEKDDDLYLHEQAQKIVNEYDFIAVTERFDESMVVLNMLLNDNNNNNNENKSNTERIVPLGDMLYVKAKSKGGYDDGGKGGLCTYIQPSNLTAEMKKYIESDEWHQRVKWDEALWYAADRSLDLTIDKLGRTKFEQKLALYRQAQRSVNDRCRSHAAVPCEGGGWKRKPEETNCLFQDSGCAWECIDQFVTEWNNNVTNDGKHKHGEDVTELLWL